MQAIVIQPFKGRRDEDAGVSDLVPGDKISGELAMVAIENGWAEEISDEDAARIDAMTDEERAEMRREAAEVGGAVEAPRKKRRRDAE